MIIAGAGAVGASLAWRLAPKRKVVILEREAQPGYHSTGRSAAHYTDVIGGEIVQALSSLTREFIDNPPDGFSDAPLLTSRPVLLLFGRHTEHPHFSEESLAHVIGRILHRLDHDACMEKCPILKSDMFSHGLWEPTAGDIDVNAIHQGYLRGARRVGATVVCDAEIMALYRRDSLWVAETRAGVFSAPAFANCTGAWGDVIGDMAGAQTVDLQPMRRTAFTFDGPNDTDFAGWPLVADDGESFYFKPDAGRILASLSDETPSPPCDAQPEELDIALAAQRVMEWTDLAIHQIASRWAGLRSFVDDRLPVTGFDPDLEGFFWNVGQGGAGIQTSAGLSAFAAAVMLDEEIPAKLADVGITRRTLSPARLRV